MATPGHLNGRVWVAGHGGMVGSALVRRLRSEQCELLTVDRTHLDLRDAAAVRQWVADHRPDHVILAAAKVGGIAANARYPICFLQDNLLIETSVIAAAASHDVQRLIFLGSSCVYPRLAPQPLKEESLLTGPLESTNQWYAVAKIAGIKLCEAYAIEEGRHFSSVMPTNLYGPNDNFELETSHVLPALIHKLHLAKERRAPTVTLWGTGEPRREFLHVDDCADAVVHILKHQVDTGMVNIGVGEDITIRRLAELIAQVVGWEGEFVFDTARPDGTSRKLMDVSRIRQLGWKPTVSLQQGITDTYSWFVENVSEKAPGSSNSYAGE